MTALGQKLATYLRACGCASSEIAEISPANRSSSNLPIEPEVWTAITISPNPRRSTEGKYSPDATYRRLGGVQR
jgi:hypothetical protein